MVSQFFCFWSFLPLPLRAVWLGPLWGLLSWAALSAAPALFPPASLLVSLLPRRVALYSLTAVISCLPSLAPFAIATVASLAVRVPRAALPASVGPSFLLGCRGAGLALGGHFQPTSHLLLVASARARFALVAAPSFLLGPRPYAAGVCPSGSPRPGSSLSVASCAVGGVTCSSSALVSLRALAPRRLSDRLPRFRSFGLTVRCRHCWPAAVRLPPLSSLLVPFASCRCHPDPALAGS